VVIDEDELKKVVTQVLTENGKAVEDYKKGKQASIMFLLGQVMRKIGKKVDATIVKKAIEKDLK
jgi:aspartyl-tRNA(Asn)/glutamyl-tRNA(Gln) amidotransferase subunit B